jgi:hypothetical protein
VLWTCGYGRYESLGAADVDSVSHRQQVTFLELGGALSEADRHRYAMR